MTADQLIAYKGEVTLERAVWDTDWGMYTIFKLEQHPQDKNNANPFKRFTKMRKGKVGTRFDAVFTTEGQSSGPVVVYADHVMLKGWSDGVSGWKVTLWHHGTEAAIETHPFMDYKRDDLFALVLVELEDDEEPVNQVKRERLTRAEARRFHPLAMFAGQLCNNEFFQRYLEERTGHKHGLEEAASWIRLSCGVQSRRELDEYPEAGERFHRLVRKPYQNWYEENVSSGSTR